MNDQAQDFEVLHDENTGGGRYYVPFFDGSAGEMTYTLVSPDIMSINHTFVPEQHRGGPHALAMVTKGVTDAREKGLKVRPVCWYVALQFRRHREWQHLLAG